MTSGGGWWWAVVINGSERWALSFIQLLSRRESADPCTNLGFAFIRGWNLTGYVKYRYWDVFRWNVDLLASKSKQKRRSGHQKWHPIHSGGAPAEGPKARSLKRRSGVRKNTTNGHLFGLAFWTKNRTKNSQKGIQNSMPKIRRSLTKEQKKTKCQNLETNCFSNGKDTYSQNKPNRKIAKHMRNTQHALRVY